MIARQKLRYKIRNCPKDRLGTTRTCGIPLNVLTGRISDPAAEAIGVTVAVAHHFTGTERVKLEVIAALNAWPTGINSPATLPPGTLVTGSRIVRGNAGASEPYLVFFESGGREYSCALHTFLPRTQSVQLAAEGVPLENALAV